MKSAGLRTGSARLAAGRGGAAATGKGGGTTRGAGGDAALRAGSATADEAASLFVPPLTSERSGPLGGAYRRLLSGASGRASFEATIGELSGGAGFGRGASKQERIALRNSRALAGRPSTSFASICSSRRVTDFGSPLIFSSGGRCIKCCITTRAIDPAKSGRPLSMK